MSRRHVYPGGKDPREAALPHPQGHKGFEQPLGLQTGLSSSTSSDGCSHPVRNRVLGLPLRFQSCIRPFLYPYK